ncbi:MAG: tRNA lysidine(34) synthetase TilS, partial [Terriglobales bacterium]
LELASDQGLQLSIVHFDHAWRPESGADATWVGALAARLQIAFHLGHAAGPRPTANREQSARRARYGYFQGLIAAGVADRIATGHTQDDQAETVLLRMLRGAGPAGLAGIWPSRPIAVGAAPGTLVRPVLGLSHAALQDWLRARGQIWRDDPSNQDQSLRRNWVRHALMPILRQEVNPALAAGLGTLAEVMRAEEENWAQVMGPLADKVWRVEGVELITMRAELLAFPLAAQRRLLREGVRRLRGNLLRLQFHHVEAVVQALRQGPHPPRHYLLAGVECQLNRREVRLGRPPARSNAL